MEAKGRRWNEEMLEEFLQPRDIRLAKRILVAYFDRRDIWEWVHETHGRYTVRSGYRVGNFDFW